MTTPTTEQLLILADRAGRGRLTPAEVAVLRAGIQALADQRENDRRTIGGLQAATRTWRNKAHTRGGDPVNEQTQPTPNWIPA
jgi:hypothetical protein